MFVWLIVSTDKQFIENELFARRKILLKQFDEGKKEFSISPYENVIIFYLPINTQKQKNMIDFHLNDVKTIMQNNKYNMNLIYSKNMNIVFGKIKKQLELELSQTSQVN